VAVVVNAPVGVGRAPLFRDVLARVAVPAEAHRVHSCIPVPALAVRLLAVAAARCVELDSAELSFMGACDLSVADAVQFMQRAPINIGALSLFGFGIDGSLLELPLVVAALAENPCYGFMRALRMPELEIDAASSEELVAAASGFACLRVLEVWGPGGVTIVAAAQRTLRDLTLHAADVACLDLSRSRVSTLCVAYCAELAAVQLPPSLIALGDDAFSECPRLLTVDLSHTQLRAAGDRLFRSCSALQEALLPPSLRKLGDFAFNCCPALRRIDCSRTQLQSVGSNLACDCATLTHVELPPSLKEIGEVAFTDCPLLPVVDLSHTQLRLGEAKS
jgi:hypothetical protein